MGGRQVANVFAEEEEISKTESPRQGQIKTRVNICTDFRRREEAYRTRNPPSIVSLQTALYLPLLHCSTDFDSAMCESDDDDAISHSARVHARSQFAMSSEFFPVRLSAV
jgi:hypothetical protein